MKSHTAEIAIIFTSKGFYADGNTELMLETDGERYKCYERDAFRTLYFLGLRETTESLGQAERFLYLVSTAFFGKLTDIPELEIARERVNVELDTEDCESLLQSLPFSVGTEYVDEAWISCVFEELNEIFKREITRYKGTVALYLAEQKKNLHVPLKYALTEYENDREKLLALLSCLNRAAELSPLIAGFMESGKLFYALYLNSEQPHLTVDGVTLNEEDIRRLLGETEGLILLKGKWVEVNHAKLMR